MKRFKKYWYEKVKRGKMAYTYKIIEMGVKDSDPFPELEIPLVTNARMTVTALNEANFQGYKLMAETLIEVTKGVIDADS